MCYGFPRVRDAIRELSIEVPCSKTRYPSRRQNRLRSLFQAFRHVAPLRNRPNRHKKSRHKKSRRRFIEPIRSRYTHRLGVPRAYPFTHTTCFRV